MKNSVYCLLITVLLLPGCGSFDLFKSKDVDRETEEVRTAVKEFRAFESFSAEIPVGLIKAIRLPSGAEVVFKEGVSSEVQGARARGDTVLTAEGAEESQSFGNEPMVRLGYERGEESRDSVRVVEREDRTESVERETSVETGSWLVWLFVGIGVALAGVVVLWIYKPW